MLPVYHNASNGRYFFSHFNLHLMPFYEFLGGYRRWSSSSSLSAIKISHISSINSSAAKLQQQVSADGDSTKIQLTLQLIESERMEVRMWCENVNVYCCYWLCSPNAANRSWGWSSPPVVVQNKQLIGTSMGSEMEPSLTASTAVAAAAGAASDWQMNECNRMMLIRIARKEKNVASHCGDYNG